MEKVLLTWKGGDVFGPNETLPHHELSPKELMLYSMGLCVGKTVVSIFDKMRVVITSFLIEADGTLTDDPPKANSLFTRFTQVFRIEAPDPEDHSKITRAITLAHDKYCGVTIMFSKIAPVEIELILNGEITEFK